MKTVSVNGAKVRFTLPTDKVTSIFFLGLGQGGRNLEWVAAEAPSDMAVVEALPFMKARDEVGMIRLGIESIQTVLRSIDIKNLTVVCESQSAPAVVLALRNANLYAANLVCIAPLGFNYDRLGRSASGRMRKLVSNSVRFWSHKNQQLNLAANRETLKVIMKETVPRPYRTMKALHMAANLNVAAEAEQLAHTIPVHVFAGDNDEHFPFHEIANQLGGGTQIKLHKLDRERHLNRATEQGIHQLQRIMKVVAQKNRQLAIQAQ